MGERVEGGKRRKGGEIEKEVMLGNFGKTIQPKHRRRQTVGNVDLVKTKNGKKLNFIENDC